MAEDYVGNTTSSRPPKDNLKLSIADNTWFSPHEQSTKKQVSFDVLDIDETGASWTVTIRKDKQTYQEYTGSGSQTLSWDGLLNGAAVPEGKYNIVLKNAKQPGKGRERDVVQVGVDMSPPEISYEIVKTATGRDTGQLKVVIKDPQSGVDHAKTVVKNLSPEVKPGVPVVNPVARSSAETFAKQVGLYDLLFPTFEPTQQASSGGDFSIASLDGALPDAGFASLLTFNNLGLKAVVKMFGTNINNTPIPLSGDCRTTAPIFGKHNIELIGAFDYDRLGKNTCNVTLYFKLSSINDNLFGGVYGDYNAAKNHYPSGN